MDAASHRYSMEVVHFDPGGVEFYCTSFCKCSSLQGLRYQYQWWACQVLLHWAGYFVDVADFHCWGSTAGYCLQWSICLFFCLVWNHIYCLHNTQRFFFWCLFQRSKGAGRLGQQKRIRRSLHKEEASNLGFKGGWWCQRHQQNSYTNRKQCWDRVKCGWCWQQH